MPTITTSGAAIIRAGLNANETIRTVSGAYVNTFVDQAEAYLCNLVKFDIVTNWASLNAVYKLLFSEYAERLAAIDTIMFDMSGYTSRVEAEDLINVHWARIMQIKEILDKSDVQDFQGV